MMKSNWTGCGKRGKLVSVFVALVYLVSFAVSATHAQCVQSASQTFVVEPQFTPFTLDLASTFSSEDIVLWQPNPNRSETRIIVNVATLAESINDVGQIRVDTSTEQTKMKLTFSASILNHPSTQPTPAANGPSDSSKTGASTGLKPSISLPILVSLLLASVTLYKGCHNSKSTQMSMVLLVVVSIIGCQMVRAPCPPKLVITVHVPWNIGMVCNYGQCYSNADVWKHGVCFHFAGSHWSARSLLPEAYGSIRTDSNWGGVETTQGNYDFSRFTNLVNFTQNSNLGNLWILDYGNTLYTSTFTTGPTTTTQVNAFTAYAKALLTNFRNLGVYWEMWNEPDLSGFWAPTPDPVAYGRLAVEVGKMIRANLPEQVFVGPGIANIHNLNYIKSVLQSNVVDYLDAWSFHPYRKRDSPETMISDFFEIRQMLKPFIRTQGKNLPLIPTEFGYSTVWDASITNQVQAMHFARARFVQLLLDTPISFWYDFKDDGTDPLNAEHAFGTIFVNDTAKPAYSAARFQAQLLNDFVLSKRIEVSHSPYDFVLLFRPKNITSESMNTGKLVFAIWTSQPTNFNPPSVTLKIPCGSSTSVPAARRYSMYGATQGTISCTSGTYTVTATGQPQYLVVDFGGLSAVQNSAVVFLKMMAAVPRLPLDLIPGSNFSAALPLPVDASTSDIKINLFPSDGLVIDRATVPFPSVPAVINGASNQTISIDSQSPTHALVRIQIPPLRMWREQYTSNRGTMQGYAKLGVSIASPSNGPATTFKMPYTPLSVSLTMHPIDSTGRLRIDADIPPQPTALTYTLEISNVSGACCSGSLSATATTSGTSPTITFYFGALNGAASAGAAYNLSSTLFGPANFPSSTELAPMMTSHEAKFYVPFAYTASSVSNVNLVPTGTATVHTLSFSTNPPTPCPVSGVGLFRLDYNNPNSDAYFGAYLNSRIRLGNFLSASMWVYGDMSFSLLKIVVSDANNQFFMMFGTPATIDWSGWKYVTFELTSISNYWNGPNDGIPVAPIYLNGLFLLDPSVTSNPITTSSSVWFSAPLVAVD